MSVQIETSAYSAVAQQIARVNWAGIKQGLKSDYRPTVQVSDRFASEQAGLISLRNHVWERYGSQGDAPIEERIKMLDFVEKALLHEAIELKNWVNFNQFMKQTMVVIQAKRFSQDVNPLEKPHLIRIFTACVDNLLMYQAKHKGDCVIDSDLKKTLEGAGKELNELSGTHSSEAFLSRYASKMCQKMASSSVEKDAKWRKMAEIGLSILSLGASLAGGVFGNPQAPISALRQLLEEFEGVSIDKIGSVYTDTFELRMLTRRLLIEEVAQPQNELSDAIQNLMAKLLHKPTTKLYKFLTGKEFSKPTWKQYAAVISTCSTLILFHDSRRVEGLFWSNPKDVGLLNAGLVQVDKGLEKDIFQILTRELRLIYRAADPERQKEVIVRMADLLDVKSDRGKHVIDWIERTIQADSETKKVFGFMFGEDGRIDRDNLRSNLFGVALDFSKQIKVEKRKVVCYRTLACIMSTISLFLVAAYAYQQRSEMW